MPRGRSEAIGDQVTKQVPLSDPRQAELIEIVVTMRHNEATDPSRRLLEKAQQLLENSPVSAAEHAEEALAFAQRRADLVLIGEAAMLAAQAHVLCGQYKQAEACVAQSITAFDAGGLRKQIGAAYVMQSQVLYVQDRISDAYASSMKALGYPGLPAKARAHLFATVAACFCDRADLPSGRRVMQEHALPEAERSDDPATFVILHSRAVGMMHVYALWSMGIPHANTVGLARPLLERPQIYLDTAKRYAAACEPLLASCGPSERVFAEAHRALLLSLTDGWTAALSLFEETLARAADLPRATVSALARFGLAARVAGQWETARARLEEARAHPAGQAACLQRVFAFDLAQVYAGLDEQALALDAMNRFIHLQTSKGKLATGWLEKRGRIAEIRGPVDSGEPANTLAKPTTPALLKRAIEFIELNLTRRLVLAEVARHVGISTRTLRSLHTEHYGMSASEFIRERRMQRAKALLTQGHTSISEVADLIGYSSPANFSRDFRRRFGRAPSTDRVETD